MEGLEPEHGRGTSRQRLNGRGTRNLMKHLSALAAMAISISAFAAPSVKTEHVDAQLLAERTAAQPAKPITVGLQLRMAPEWHTYWKNPGDSGVPTRIQWILPEGR